MRNFTGKSVRLAFWLAIGSGLTGCVYAPETRFVPTGPYYQPAFMTRQYASPEPVQFSSGVGYTPIYTPFFYGGCWIGPENIHHPRHGDWERDCHSRRNLHLDLRLDHVFSNNHRDNHRDNHQNHNNHPQSIRIPFPRSAIPNSPPRPAPRPSPPRARH